MPRARSRASLNSVRSSLPGYVARDSPPRGSTLGMLSRWRFGLRPLPQKPGPADESEGQYCRDQPGDGGGLRLSHPPWRAVH